MEPEQNEFQQGKTLLLNKPKTWTSFDVVNKIRYAIPGKVKVGHAGTLDPLATGLLIICTGKHTKKLADFMGMEKEYTGIIQLGETTPSYDLETEADQTFDISHITEVMIHETAKKFTGTLLQYPPIFSAIKQKGIPIHRLARKGKAVKTEAREVEITKFEVTKIDLPEVHFRVVCSKGTYIRSLAHDFGKALGAGAYLKELTRTRIGVYKLQDAWELEDFVNLVKQQQ